MMKVNKLEALTSLIASIIAIMLSANAIWDYRISNCQFELSDLRLQLIEKLIQEQRLHEYFNSYQIIRAPMLIQNYSWFSDQLQQDAESYMERIKNTNDQTRQLSHDIVTKKRDCIDLVSEKIYLPMIILASYFLVVFLSYLVYKKRKK
jgi:uncharacterized protein YPO0396